MLEKTGTVALTESDLQEYNKGLVSQRIKDTWGFSLDELRAVVETRNYTIITKEV